MAKEVIGLNIFVKIKCPMCHQKFKRDDAHRAYCSWECRKAHNLAKSREYSRQYRIIHKTKVDKKTI